MPVPTVPIGQPFKLREGKVHDLPSGDMLSFRFGGGGGERLYVIAGSEESNQLERSRSFTPSNGCQIDYIDFERNDSKIETVTFRVIVSAHENP